MSRYGKPLLFYSDAVTGNASLADVLEIYLTKRDVDLRKVGARRELAEPLRNPGDYCGLFVEGASFLDFLHVLSDAREVGLRIVVSTAYKELTARELGVEGVIHTVCSPQGFLSGLDAVFLPPKPTRVHPLPVFKEQVCPTAS